MDQSVCLPICYDRLCLSTTENCTMTETAKQQPKVFIIILDALKRTTLMESLDARPQFIQFSNQR